MPQTKKLPVSVTIKRTAIVNHNQNYRLESAKIKLMARECRNKKNYQGVSQLKGLPGSATIKGTAKEYHNQMDFREYYNQKDCNIQNDCQGVPQSTEMSISGSTKIKMTARVIVIKRNTREYHNQNDSQGV